MSELHDRRAFTLIELLVVTAIMAVVITVIGGALAAGLRVWRVSKEYNSFETGTRIEMAILEKDLMNTFNFHARPLEGTRMQISMPGATAVTRDEGMPWAGGPVTVKYSLSDDGTTLLRKTWAFPGKEPPDSLSEAMIKGIQRLNISYLSVDGSVAQGRPMETWVGEWSNPTNLPAGVRFRLVFPSEDGEPRTIDRTFILPCGEWVTGGRK